MIHDHRLRGMCIAALGVFVISFDALLVRLAAVDAVTVSFYRGLFMGLSMLLLWQFRGVHSWRPADRKELWVFALIVMLSALSTTLFVFSVKYTAAANTVVLLATSSFFAAVFTYLLLGERIAKSTLAAIVISFIGVLIVFGNSLSLGGGWIGDLLGLSLAVVMGLELTLLRKYAHFPKLMIIALSGFLAAFAMLFASDALLDISAQTLLWLLLMGLVQMPLAIYLIFLATRYISSAEVSLFSTIETTLAPVWLWLFLAEIPPKMTVVGGSLVIAAILVNALPKITAKR